MGCPILIPKSYWPNDILNEYYTLEHIRKRGEELEKQINKKKNLQTKLLNKNWIKYNCDVNC